MTNSALKTLSKKSNGFYLAVFFILFVTALVISICIRSIHLYNSAYFTSDSIMVLVVTEKNSHIMRLDTQSNKISQLKISDVALDASNLKNASINTGVPLHAAIQITGAESEIDQLLQLRSAIGLLVSGDLKLTQLNEWDILRIAYEARKVPSENRVLKDIKNYVHDRSIISQIDHELYELFRDPEVINEQISVEVINATSMSGLASSVAKMLENGGYTVVSIRSSDPAKSSIQTNSPDTITAYHIQKIFDFPVTPLGKNAVSDIRVIIGDNAVE